MYSVTVPQELRRDVLIESNRNVSTDGRIATFLAASNKHIYVFDLAYRCFNKFEADYNIWNQYAINKDRLLLHCYKEKECEELVIVSLDQENHTVVLQQSFTVSSEWEFDWKTVEFSNAGRYLWLRCNPKEIYMCFDLTDTRMEMKPIATYKTLGKSALGFRYVDEWAQFANYDTSETGVCLKVERIDKEEKNREVIWRLTSAQMGVNIEFESYNVRLVEDWVVFFGAQLTDKHSVTAINMTTNQCKQYRHKDILQAFVINHDSLAVSEVGMETEFPRRIRFTPIGEPICGDENCEEHEQTKLLRTIPLTQIV